LTDVSGKPIGPIFKDQEIQEIFMDFRMYLEAWKARIGACVRARV
jgi:hypothetical protein